MKEIIGIYKITTSGIDQIAIDCESGTQCSVREMCRKIRDTQPHLIQAPGKKRRTQATQIYYIINIDAAIDEIVTQMLHHYSDITSDTQNPQYLHKGQMCYAVAAVPKTAHYIAIKTQSGAIIRICNAGDLVRKIPQDNGQTAAIIRRTFDGRHTSISAAALAKWGCKMHAIGATVYADESKQILPTGESVDEYMRDAYSGGWCYCNVADSGPGVRLDIHHLYPSILASGAPADKDPQYIDNRADWEQVKDDTNKCYFVRFSCRFDLRRGALPFVTIHTTRGGLIKNVRTSKIDINGKKVDSSVTLTMCGQEYAAFRTWYKIKDFDFIDAVVYGKTTSSRAYVMPLYNAKEKYKTSDPVQSDICKMYNNSLTGAMARKTDALNLVYSLTEPPRMQKTEIKAERHTAIAAYITGCGRARLAGLANQLRYRFLYCDTDSLHLSGQDIPDCIKVSPALGDFGIEAYFDRGIYYGQKQYIEWADDKIVNDKLAYRANYKVCLAGLPEKYQDKIGDALTGGIDIFDRRSSDIFSSVAEDIKAGRPCTIPYRLDGVPELLGYSLGDGQPLWSKTSKQRIGLRQAARQYIAAHFRPRQKMAEEREVKNGIIQSYC